MKKLKKIILVLLLLIIVALVGVVFYIDSIARTAVEKGGTWALGVETKLDSASIGLFSGKTSLTTLQVKNPAGYTSPHFFKLGGAELDLRLTSLFSDKITVPRLAFKDIDVHLERNATDANYNVIMNNLKKFESNEAPPPDESQKEGKKFIIEVIEIENINVHVNLVPVAGLGEIAKVDLKVPKLTLKNVGAEDDGANMAEITDVVLKAILTAVAEKGEGILPPGLLGDLKGKLASLEGLQGLGMEVVGNVVGDVSKQIEDVTKDVGKQIEKGLGELGKDVGKDLTKDLGKDLGKSLDDNLKKGIGDLLPGKKKE